MSDAEDLRDRIKQLESQVEQQQKHIQQLERDAVEHPPAENSGNRNNNLSRRSFLKTLAGGAAGLSMLGMASGFEVRSPDGFSFFGNGNNALDVDTQGQITADSIDLGQGAVGNLAGDNLSIDSSGNLNAASGLSVSDGGSQVLDGPSDINFGADLSVADDGDGTVTVTGSGSTGGDLHPTSVNNVMYAKEYSGATLAQKVAAAIADLPGGQGEVRVTPKDDGTAWTWDSTVTIDADVTPSVMLYVARGTDIDYTGSDWCLAVTNANDTENIAIKGGRWTASGTDPNGWLQIKDSYGTIVEPASVHGGGWQNSSNTCKAISIENHDWWSEHTLIRDCRLEADICIDCVPASFTGGSGTDSHHETMVQNVDTRGRVYGMRTRGNMDYSLLSHVTFKAGADGWTGLQLEHDFMRGASVIACKWEDNGNRSNTTGVSGDCWYGPTFISPFQNAIDTPWDTGGENVFMRHHEGKHLEIRCPGNDYTWRFDGSGNGNGGIELQNGSNTVRLENRNGELVAVDNNGNTTTLT